MHDHNNNPINFKLKRKKSDPLLSEIDAKNIESSINASELKITEITKKPTTVRPRGPFITSTLQQVASSRLGLEFQELCVLLRNYMRQEELHI